MLSRLIGNLAYGRALENQLTNGWLEHIRWAFIPAVILGALLVIGFGRLLITGYLVVGIYVVLYGVAIALYWSSVIDRFLVPMLPIAFACLVGGAVEIAQRTGRKWIYPWAALFAGWYLLSGFQIEKLAAAQERGSPFPTDLVKYPTNYDLQRLALWWKEHTSANELYACEQVNILRALTGRSGVQYPATNQPEVLEKQLRSMHARFLFVDLQSAQGRNLAALVSQSSRYQLLRQEAQAQLYELSDWRTDQ
jgi:hypothetical protein